MLVLIALLVGLPVLGMGQLLMDRAQRDARETELARATAGASSGAATVGDRLATLVDQTESISASITIRQLVVERDAPGLEQWLADLRPLYAGDVRQLFILLPAGEFLASAPSQRGLSGTSFSHVDYFVGGTNPWRPFVSQVYRTTFDNQPPAATIAVPILSAHGDPLGLLCAAIDLTRAQAWLGPLTALFDDVYVVDQSGRLIFGVNGSDTTPLRDLSADPNVAAAVARSDVNTESEDLFAGARRFVASAHVPGIDWTVLVGQSPVRGAGRMSALSDGLLVMRLSLVGLLLGAGVLLSRTTLRQQRLALANLERLNESKSDFVAVVSHELRTPLTGIQGFSEMIRDEELTPAEIKDFANDINTEARRLTRMITAMLDLDRMESGKMVQHRELIDLGSVIAEAVDRQRTNAPQHQFAIAFDLTPSEVWADRDQITQVVTNLLSNAVKYAPEGGAITVGVVRLGDAAHCWVRDEGMGIPERSLEDVFERYSRVETTKTRTIQGTGLGLPIVREICQAHGGRVWVESLPGKGSTFHFTLPLDARRGS